MTHMCLKHQTPEHPNAMGVFLEVEGDPPHLIRKLKKLHQVNGCLGREGVRKEWVWEEKRIQRVWNGDGRSMKRGFDKIL